jgi:hypothetical protein
MSEKHFATGRCLCGKVKYTISSPPVRMGQCHCDDCRRSTGTGHASNAFFEKKDVHIEGETSSYGSTTETKSVVTRYFCPTCGSTLFASNNVTTNTISVAVGTIDDTSWFKPDMIFYNKSKPKWDLMDMSVPSYEKMPPSINKK